MTLPPFPLGTPRATAEVPLRFEDISQDGRILLEALPNAIGPTIWRGLLRHDPASRALFRAGIIPILSRFVFEGAAGPFSVNTVLEAEGTYRLSRAEDGRFMLDMWTDLHGKIGRTYGASPRDGERALAGRVYAEHVLTRPFGPPDQRRVTSIEVPGVPPVTESRPASPSYDSIASVPAGATPLEPARSLDALSIVFGLVHTDSNLHVNSLVYLRIFEEAALRRFATLGRGTHVLGRRIDIAYRKPCFAGQTARVVQQAYEVGGRLGVASVLVDEKDVEGPETLSRAKPHAYARLDFEP